MEKHYYSLNDYLQKTFGEKVYKLSLDLGLTCPNRDGTLDTRGCIFCLAGSSHFSAAEGSIAEKLERARSLVAKKTKAERFIAYFQSYTNTYAEIDYLDRVFNETADREEIVALSVATRPDCLSDAVVALLADINKRKPVWVELGLQTSNEKTAEYLRRCYKNEVYTDAVARLKAAGLQVITHVIIGLPNETDQDVYKTLDFAVSAGTDGIKLQLLHILRGTDLYDDYIEKGFEVLTLEGYMDILFECIERIPEHIVIHRITGDAPKAHLVAPLWSADKRNVLNTINRELARRGIRQGSKLKKQ